MILRGLCIYLAAVNVTLLAMMGIDKRRAIQGKWRIRERTLFVTAALGGSIGGILGMQLFRHKTRHLRFKLGFPAILLLQIALAVGIYSLFHA